MQSIGVKHAFPLTCTYELFHPHTRQNLLLLMPELNYKFVNVQIIRDQDSHCLSAIIQFGQAMSELCLGKKEKAHTIKRLSGKKCQGMHLF